MKIWDELDHSDWVNEAPKGVSDNRSELVAMVSAAESDSPILLCCKSLLRPACSSNTVLSGLHCNRFGIKTKA